MTKNLAIAAVFACAAANSALAAEDNVGIWGIFTTEGAFDTAEGPGPWRYWFDAQLRYFDVGSGINQYQLRPGIGYAISDNMSVHAGYMYVHASNGSGRTVTEDRLWQQLTWNIARWSHGTLSMRARFQQRSVSTGDDLGWQFQYLMKYVRPIGSTENLDFIVSVEPFFILRDTDWGAESGLSQNRTAIGLGWKLSPTIAIETGYMHQYIPVDDAEDLVNHLGVVNFKVKF
jgi:Protein of unknown function (DUF2490)